MSTNLVEARMWIVPATVAEPRVTFFACICWPKVNTIRCAGSRGPSSRFTVRSSKWTHVRYISGKHAIVPIDQSLAALFRRAPSPDLAPALITISGCPSGDGDTRSAGCFLFLVYMQSVVKAVHTNIF